MARLSSHGPECLRLRKEIVKDGVTTFGEISYRKDGDNKIAKLVKVGTIGGPPPRWKLKARAMRVSEAAMEAADLGLTGWKAVSGAGLSQ